MKEHEQRIAIAEACGWMRDARGGYLKGHKWTHSLSDIPDYLNDLNAMHEAEKTLSEEQALSYVNALFSKFDSGDGWDQSSIRMVFFPFICANAAQRAEAFLRALGKW